MAPRMQEYQNRNKEPGFKLEGGGLLDLPKLSNSPALFSKAAIHSSSSIPATTYTSESASATADAGNSLSATTNRQLPLRHSKSFRSTELPQKAFSSIHRRSHETQQLRQGMMRRVSPSQLSNHHMKT
ncbi:hypothetical protein L2E82_26734 [Cichorium intybus]|uniref:Uncharacterized protein n=1 Tax=Cichorium intybus TaxID=13427 RepID=A0ACB9CR07_CICIN|nr:hypothetical protein L2E82_26734 [Cichorium intybus]